MKQVQQPVLAALLSLLACAADGKINSVRVTPDLNGKLPPSGNFNLAVWNLQEPTDTTVSSSTLIDGYQDSYFYTDPADGSITFWDPENGVPTSGSNYPRSELREVNADGSNAAWSTTSTPKVYAIHMLAVADKVNQVPDHVCIGQIFQASTSTQASGPYVELFYYNTGKITVGIEQTTGGGDEVQTTLATVTLGTEFSYELGIKVPPKGTPTLFVNINGAKWSQPMTAAFAGESFYFKAGDYDQTAGSSPAVGATVNMHHIVVKHSYQSL